MRPAKGYRYAEKCQSKRNRHDGWHWAAPGSKQVAIDNWSNVQKSSGAGVVDVIRDLLELRRIDPCLFGS